MLRIRYYGWPLVGIGFLFYGLGIAPAYYSWGFFAPEIIEDLEITRQQVGEIFGTFALTLSLVSLLSATSINRWGLRVTVTVGALVAALGWYLVGKAESLIDLYISYAFLGGVGLGLSIASDIIRSHGGEISLGKSTLGGLKVKIFLPF